MKRSWQWLAIIGLFSLIITSCGGGGGGGSTTPAPTAPSAPSNLTASAGNSQVALAWTASAGAASYNIYYGTVTGVTNASPTKVTGLTGTSYTIPSLTNGTTYYSVVTAVNANGESGYSNEVSATPNDLTGTWNFIHFYAGPSRPGWVHGTATITSGNITHSNLAASGTAPDYGTATWTMNTDRTITETGGTGILSASHLVISSNMQIIVGTSSNGSDRLIRIYIKQVPGVTFSNSDLSNTSFAFHDLRSGSDIIWAYGTGSINGLMQQSFATITPPTGHDPLPVPAVASLSISAPGIITSNDPAFHGIMTPDKQTIFSTTTSGTLFTLRIFQRTGQAGQTYALADLAGTWYEHTLASHFTLPYGDHATLTFNDIGFGNYTKYVRDGAAIADFSINNITLDSTGIIGMTGDPDINGFMSLNKDLFVITSTKILGNLYTMSIDIK